MPVQTSYGFKAPIGIEGGLADSGFKDARSMLAEVAIPFGRLVVQGTAQDQCKLPTASTDLSTAGRPLGLSLFTSMQPNSIAGGDAQYAAKDCVSVLRKGRAWVVVEEAVLVNDAVFVRYASGSGGTALGSFRKSADTATAGALTGAKYVTAAGIGGLAQVQFDLL